MSPLSIADHRNRRSGSGRHDRVFDLVSGYGPDVRSLCQAYRALLPDVTGLGLSGPVISFAGDAEVAGLQDVPDEGPAHDITRLGRPVQIADLTAPCCRQRWPRFTPAALEAGIRAAYALPLHAGGVHHHGAVTVYRDTPGGWDDARRTTIETFAAAATELITLHERGPELAGVFGRGSIMPVAAGPPLIRWFELASLPAVRHHLHTVACRALADDDRYRFVLAVHEAMTNAVLHGGGQGQLLLWQRDDHLWCEISDHGPGIGPAGTRAAGRGLRIIEQAAGSLDVITDRTGTRVLLSHRLDPGRGDAAWHHDQRRVADTGRC